MLQVMGVFLVIGFFVAPSICGVSIYIPPSPPIPPAPSPSDILQNVYLPSDELNSNLPAGISVGEVIVNGTQIILVLNEKPPLSGKEADQAKLDIINAIKTTDPILSKYPLSVDFVQIPGGNWTAVVSVSPITGPPSPEDVL